MQKREEARRLAEMEAATAEFYAAAALRHAQAGRTSAAWKCADAAHCAAKCADQAHDELWDAAKGELSDAEWEAFLAAEAAVTAARKAKRSAAAAVARANAAR